MSVKARGPQNARGERAIAIMKSPGVVNCNVGIGEQHETNLSFKVYPNPNKGVFKVQYVGNEDIYNMAILDIQGRIVRSVTPDFDNASKTVDIDASFLENGIYFIKLEGETRIGVSKLIKN